MEAWIVHIRQESILESDHNYVSNNYSAWASEKLAYKCVGKWIMESTKNTWNGPFVDDDELRDAVRALVEADKVKEAIGIINKYSRPSGPKKNAQPSSHKITFTITQSKFLGSVWE